MLKLAPSFHRTPALAGLLALLATGCSVAGPAPTPEATQTFQLCSQCHGEDARGNLAYNAPSIAGLPPWYLEEQLRKFKAGGRGTHFDDLTGMQMRPMALSLGTDAEIARISEYVSKLPAAKPQPTLTGGDPERGRALYGVCTACHQADGAGNQALKAPPLTHANDWYMASQLKKFKLGIRGTNPKDVSGATMRPMAQTLTDDKAIADVVAYIVTLQK